MITSLHRQQSSYVSKPSTFQRTATPIPAQIQDTFKSNIRFGEDPNTQWRFNKDGKLIPAKYQISNLTRSDVEEYLNSNFGQDDILAEDKEIYEKLIRKFTKGGVFDTLKQNFREELNAGNELNLSYTSHADLGPTFLLNGFAKALNTTNYKMDLIDTIRQTRELMHRSLYGMKPEDLPFQEMMWNKFRDFMKEKGGSLWNSSFDDIRDHSQLIYYDLHNIPKNRYHASLLFFPKGLTDSEHEFEQAIKNHVAQVKEGGLVAGAMMLGSSEWRFGQYWQPDNTPLTKEFIEQSFKKAGIDIKAEKLENPPAIRDGYDGILVYTGIKPKDAKHDSQ